MIKLELIGGPVDGKEYKFSQSFVIGRDKTCEVPIAYDKFSSRMHAEVILREPNKAILKDLKSTNGTFFNSEQIEEVELKDKDIFRVGRTQFRINIY